MSERRTLLVVDDEPDIRLLVRSMLMGSAFDIIEASDGGEALELLTTRDDIDVVLLDIRMPGIDGFGVLERLKALEMLRGTSVIPFSADTEPEVIRRFVDQGVNDVLRKPFTALDLVKALTDADEDQ